jgi:choline-sulfatase
MKPASRPPPNILLVLTDQQRFDGLSAHGKAFGVETPHMDALVRRGVDFTRAYCAAPISGPARASLMTGLTPTQAGVYGNLGEPCAPLRTAIPTIANRMQAAGYETVYHGKWHLGGELRQYGWEVGFECSHDATTVREAARFYRDRDWIVHKRPFFHVVSLLNPHDIYFLDLLREDPVALPRWPNQGDDRSAKPWPQSARRDPVAWTEGRFENYRRFYGEKLRAVDALVGELVDEMTCSGFATNTWIVFSSDHGDMAGEHGIPFKGPYMYDGVTRVPFVVAPPRFGVTGKVPTDPKWKDFPARASSALVSHLDLAPTVLDLAGLPPAPELAGRSLVPHLLEGRPFGREAAFAEWHGMGKFVTPIRMVRTERWKYTNYVGVGEELYDMEADPAEMANLAGAPSRASELERHRALLRAQVEATGDPFFSLKPSPRATTVS